MRRAVPLFRRNDDGETDNGPGGISSGLGDTGLLGNSIPVLEIWAGQACDQPVLDLGALASVLPWLRRYPGSDRTGAWTAAAVTLLSSSRSGDSGFGNRLYDIADALAHEKAAGLGTAV